MQNDVQRVGMRALACLFLGLCCPVLPLGQCFAQDNRPTEMLEGMFDLFEKQSDQWMPGAFGKLSEAQLEKLSQVQIPVADEQRFGQQVLDGFIEKCKQQKIEVTSQGKDVKYLQGLCRMLLPYLSNAKRYRTLDVRIVEMASSDAYSIPGGHILVMRGLLETAGSEAALVGVLAHELSHLDRGHQLLTLKQAKLMRQSIDFRDQMQSMAIAFKPNRPEFETQADMDAVRWMMQAGYEPRELARLLQSWDQRQDREVPWMNFVPGFVKSHPDAGRRAQKILEASEALRGQFPDATKIGKMGLARK